MPLDKADMAARYGYALAFLKSDPDLWKLFNKAVKEGYTEGQFAAEFQASKFYQTKSSSYRQALEQQKTDPATWKENLRKQRAAVDALAGSMGANLTDAALAKVASDVIMYGWTEQELRNKLAGYITVSKDAEGFGGQAGVDESQLRKIAADYGRNPSDEAVRGWVVRIARGEATVNDYIAKSKEYAASAFPAYREQIKSGLTLRDVADPYMQAMAEILELNQSNIDLRDPMIRKALSGKNADSGKATEYSTYDFEMDLRKDPRFARTTRARTEGMNIMDQVLTDWGFRG
jgi:hypothetical protein